MNLDLVDGILFLAPGFLAIKLFHLFGPQRPHSQWEWTTWSIIVSLPISAAAAFIRPYAAPPVLVPHDSTEVAFRVVIAIFVGVAGAGVWFDIQRSGRPIAERIRRIASSSAWDLALDDAERDKRQVELILDGDSIIGTLCYGGREDNEAEGWVYLVSPERKPDADSKHKLMPGVEGVLVHRDQIKEIRMRTTKAEGERRRQEAAAQEAVSER